jgi:hypothetical protein
MIWFVLLIVVSAVTVWWLWPRAKTQRRPPPQPSRNSHTYHCVSIRYRSDACEEVRKLRDYRFLSNEAPALPLPDCRTEQCRCQYVHHDDRRMDDRRSPITSAHFFGRNQRSGTDRRRLQHAG